MPWASVVSLLHIIGLALAVGAATIKLVLLLKSVADKAFVSTYLKASPPITRQIIIGMVLLLISGVAWLVQGYPFSTRLIVKLVLVGVIFVLGLVMDNVVEPKFRAIAPEAGGEASSAFESAQKKFVTLELLTTALFYIVIVIWVFR